MTVRSKVVQFTPGEPGSAGTDTGYQTIVNKMNDYFNTPDLNISVVDMWVESRLSKINGVDDVTVYLLVRENNIVPASQNGGTPPPVMQWQAIANTSGVALDAWFQDLTDNILVGTTPYLVRSVPIVNNSDTQGNKAAIVITIDTTQSPAFAGLRPAAFSAVAIGTIAAGDWGDANLYTSGGDFVYQAQVYNAGSVDWDAGALGRVVVDWNNNIGQQFIGLPLTG